MAMESPLKILYVEDDLATRTICSFYLKKVFSDVVTANDGEQAWAILQISLPDVLILDIEMPGMSEFSLIEKMLGRDLKVPVIITSAYHDPDTLRHAASLKVRTCFDKPFKFEALRQEIVSIASSVVAEAVTHQPLPLMPIPWEPSLS